MADKKQRGRPPYPDQLTPAEWRVVEGVRHGLTNPQIAKLQGVSVDAVKYHVANVLQKLNLASRIKLRHWTGIRRGSKLFHREPAMDNNPNLGAIGQISRSVQDIDAAQRWYADVLGLEYLYSFGRLAFFNCNGLRLFLSEGNAAADSILYFSVGDIHAAQASLAARGIEFINAPHMIHRHEDGTEEWMAFFKDNEGRPLAIMSREANETSNDGKPEYNTKST